MGTVDTYQIMTWYDTCANSTAFWLLCSNASSNIWRCMSRGNLLKKWKLGGETMVANEGSVERGSLPWGSFKVFQRSWNARFRVLAYCPCVMRLGHHAIFSIISLFVSSKLKIAYWLTSMMQGHSHWPRFWCTDSTFFFTINLITDMITSFELTPGLDNG